MQILLGQDLEDHGDRDDRHDLNSGFAEIGAENDIGDMGRKSPQSRGRPAA